MKLPYQKPMLRLLTGKKYSQIKPQRLQKVAIWAFGSFVHQINSLKEVLKLKQNFQKNKLVTGKTPFFAIGPFFTHHSICLNTDFWYCILYGNNAFSIFMLSTKKHYSSFLKKKICFPENLFQSWSIENVQNVHWLSHKNMPIS